MPYITQAEAETNVTGFTAKTQEEKDRLLLQSELYLKSKCVPAFTDVTLVPDVLKQASYEAIRGIIAGALMNGSTQQVSEKRVKADTVEVQKKFVEGSVELNQYEQMIVMLIEPYANCGGANVARISLLGRL